MSEVNYLRRDVQDLSERLNRKVYENAELRAELADLKRMNAIGQQPNKMTRLQFLLTKLAEEAVEVAQIALKTQQFGLTERHPDLPLNNQKRCHAELNDLIAIVQMLNIEASFEFYSDQDAVDEKIAKVNKFYGYSKKLGLVE